MGLSKPRFGLSARVYQIVFLTLSKLTFGFYYHWFGIDLKMRLWVHTMKTLFDSSEINSIYKNLLWQTLLKILQSPSHLWVPTIIINSLFWIFHISIKVFLKYSFSEFFSLWTPTIIVIINSLFGISCSSPWTNLLKFTELFSFLYTFRQSL